MKQAEEGRSGDAGVKLAPPLSGLTGLIKRIFGAK